MNAAPSPRWKNRAQCRRSPELVAAGRRRRSGAPRFPGSSPTSWLSLTTWRPALRARVNWPVSYVGRVTLPSARGSIAKARSMISSSSIGKRTCPDGSKTSSLETSLRVKPSSPGTTSTARSHARPVESTKGGPRMPEHSPRYAATSRLGEPRPGWGARGRRIYRGRGAGWRRGP